MVLDFNFIADNNEAVDQWFNVWKPKQRRQ
jgi:hypothetical protein